MKASELIDRGIYLVNGKPYQYNAVRAEMCNYESNLRICTDVHDDIVCIGRWARQPDTMKVAPIEITDEVLIANGFNRSCTKLGKPTGMYYLNRGVGYSLISHKFHAESQYIDVSHVHQLQNAMRMLHVNENLKIKGVWTYK